MDFAKACFEEVALEGLDGITLSALWLRLETRKPKFPLRLDEDTKDYMWRAVLVPSSDLDFYKLPEPRPLLVLHDRYKVTDPETGIILEQDNIPEDIYPISIVSDAPNGDLGSCATYHARQKITHKIRDADDSSALMTLSKALEKWGESLVVVASQEKRTEALFGSETDPHLNLPAKQYCMLERIARSRYQGEVTQGKHSLMHILQDSPKTIFYFRKILQREELITSQLFNQRMLRGVNVMGKLLHLRRFFVERKPIYLGWLETLTMKLLKRPTQSQPLAEIREEMGLKEKTFKKLYQLGTKYVKTQLVAFKEVFPDSTEQEYMCKNKVRERYIRVVVLVKPFVYKTGCRPANEDDDDDEETEERGGDDDDVDDAAQLMAKQGVTEKALLIRELPMLHQVYRHIASMGVTGVSQIDIQAKYAWGGVGKLESRQLCRNLERLNLVKKIMQDQGKQRIQRYVAMRHLAKSDLHLKLEEEKVTMRLCHKQQEALAEDDQADLSSIKVEDLGSLDDSILLDFIEDSSKNTYQNQAKKNAHITYRMLRRANLIIKAVREAKVIDGLFLIQRKINKVEEEETGTKTKVDKKSVQRLVERLARRGHIKSVKTLIKYGQREKELQFLCDPSLSVEDPLVRSAIEAAKYKSIAVSKEATKQLADSKKTETEGPEGTVVRNYSLLRSLVKGADMEYDPGAGKRHGHLPRMKRIQAFHQLLWYLVYGYGQEEDLPGTSGDAGLTHGVETAGTSQGKSANLSSASQTAANSDIVDVSEMHVYCDRVDWRRFMPPLPSHQKTTKYTEGWCLIGDVLLVLPVSIFCQIIRVNFKIKGLDEMLRDPVRRNIIISKLPAQVRQQLLHERKYVHICYEICTMLCQMGLLSFGRREYKAKEQIFVFIHKNCNILDTSSPYLPSGERNFKKFCLEKFSDLNDYWFSLQWICLNTPLENITVPPVGADPVTKSSQKPDRFKDALEERDPEDTADSGDIPGDQLGAGGLDSSFFAHLHRNWTFNFDKDLKLGSLLESRRLQSKSWTMVPRRQRRKDKLTLTKSIKSSKPHCNFPGTSTQFLQRKLKARRVSGQSTPDARPPTAVIVGPNITVHGPAKKGGKGIKRKAKSPPEEEKKEEKKRRKEAKIIFEGSKNKPTGRRTASTYYDDVDWEARGRMTKERVEWTVPEDSLLLLCQVTHEFLTWPKVRRNFSVAWFDIRNLLHQELKASLDKTSKACQRRAKYMMRNKQTSLNVKMFVGEALQDKKLCAEFKKDQSYDKTSWHAVDNVEFFKNCLFRLKDKFRSNIEQQEQQKFTLPDTVEELYRRYHVTKAQPPVPSLHRDVTSDRDIYFSVLHNLIQSAMLLRDKTGRAQELFQLFSQYPEDLLLDVFQSMKTDGIITKIKKGEKRRVQMNSLPGMNMGVYQVAQRYMYRWVFSGYPNNIFNNTSSFLHQLVEGYEESTPAIPTEDRGGHCSVLIGLMACKKLTIETVIPEQIILIESQVPAEDEPTSADAAASKKKKAKKSKPVNPDPEWDEEEEQLIREMEEAKDAPEKKGQTEIQEEPATRPKNSESRMVFSQGVASRAALSLIRTQDFVTYPKSCMVSPQDLVVVNSCGIKLKLKAGCLGDLPAKTTWSRDSVAHNHIATWNRSSLLVHPKTCYYLLKHLRLLQPARLNLKNALDLCQRKHKASDLDIDLMTSIHLEVSQRKSVGLTKYEIQDKFGGRVNFGECLQLLIEQKVVVPVGTAVQRYVGYQHVRPWLIYSYKNLKGRGRRTSEGDEGDDVIELSADNLPGLPQVEVSPDGEDARKSPDHPPGERVWETVSQGAAQNVSEVSRSEAGPGKGLSRGKSESTEQESTRSETEVAPGEDLVVPEVEVEKSRQRKAERGQGKKSDGASPLGDKDKGKSTNTGKEQKAAERADMAVTPVKQRKLEPKKSVDPAGDLASPDISQSSPGPETQGSSAAETQLQVRTPKRPARPLERDSASAKKRRLSSGVVRGESSSLELVPDEEARLASPPSQTITGKRPVLKSPPPVSRLSQPLPQMRLQAADASRGSRSGQATAAPTSARGDTTTAAGMTKIPSPPSARASQIQSPPSTRASQLATSMAVVTSATMSSVLTATPHVATEVSSSTSTSVPVKKRPGKKHAQSLPAAGVRVRLPKDQAKRGIQPRVAGAAGVRMRMPAAQSAAVPVSSKAESVLLSSATATVVTSVTHTLTSVMTSVTNTVTSVTSSAKGGEAKVSMTSSLPKVTSPDRSAAKGKMSSSDVTVAKKKMATAHPLVAKGKKSSHGATVTEGKMTSSHATVAKGKVASSDAMLAEGKVASPDATVAKGKEAFLDATVAKGKEAFLDATVAKGKEAFPDATVAKGKEAFPDATVAEGKVASPEAMVAKGKVASDSTVATVAMAKIASPKATVAKGKMVSPDIKIAKGKVASDTTVATVAKEKVSFSDANAAKERVAVPKATVARGRRSSSGNRAPEVKATEATAIQATTKESSLTAKGSTTSQAGPSKITLQLPSGEQDASAAIQNQLSALAASGKLGKTGTGVVRIKLPPGMKMPAGKIRINMASTSASQQPESSARKTVKPAGGTGPAAEATAAVVQQRGGHSGGHQVDTGQRSAGQTAVTEQQQAVKAKREQAPQGQRGQVQRHPAKIVSGGPGQGQKKSPGGHVATGSRIMTSPPAQSQGRGVPAGATHALQAQLAQLAASGVLTGPVRIKLPPGMAMPALEKFKIPVPTPTGVRPPGVAASGSSHQGATVGTPRQHTRLSSPPASQQGKSPEQSQQRKSPAAQRLVQSPPVKTSSSPRPTPSTQQGTVVIEVKKVPQFDGAVDEDEEPQPSTSKASTSAGEEPTLEPASTGNTRTTRQQRQRRPPAEFEVPAAPPTTGTYQRVRLISRPWKTPEGTVNRPILKMMLEAVLMFIMSSPGLTKHRLCEKYTPILQPVPLLELVEMLEKLGCVTCSMLEAKSRPSLFSQRLPVSPASKDTGSQIMIYKPTVDCILKLGQFEHQLEGNR